LARLLPAPDPAPADAPLLRAFAITRSAEAFEDLVRRHGPMVLAACRRVLGDPDDAEDAFQAVFLVLARKAGTVRGHLAGWLYAVAVRTARGVRIMRQRRRKHEARASARGESARPPESDHDLAAVIDEELARLPEQYRQAVVLCELRGLARKEAAAELGVPEGTLSWRLATAKRKLAVLLSARGLAPAAVVALLAPASVSAGLVKSAMLAARGTAGPVASAAASSVVKAMLFDQLKAVALTAGILLSVVCGGFAMTGSGRGEQPAPAPRHVDNPAAKLVEQLGAPEFADREAATKKLRELGVNAEPALRAGVKSESPEVRARCAKILAEIRKDALDALVKNFDPKAQNVPDHPLWRRFKAVAGDSRASRELFARIIADARLARVLDAAEAAPADRVRIYRDEVARQSCNVTYVVAGETVGGHNMLLGGPKASELKPPPEPITSESLAAYFFLGSYPETAVEVTGTDRAGRPVREGLIVETFEFTRATRVGNEPVRPVVHRLFAAWLDNRVDRDTLESGYWRATANAIPDAASAARRLLAAEKLPSPAKAYAAIYLARVGNRTDVALITPLLDATVAREVVYDKPAPVQVRDAALAACLLLHDQNPAEYGFDVLRKRGSPKTDAFDMAWLGFWSNAARAATHKKANEWLEKQEKKDEPKKEEPKPDPVSVKLVEQLGAAEFTDREAAAKQLRALGVRAEPALKAALKSENPEIRQQAPKILSEIRGDRLRALAKEFDPTKVAQPDHAIWNRFRAITGNTRASRDLFAGIIKNPNWLRRLDTAEANPDAALQQYQEAVIEIGKQFQFNASVSFEIPVWPCDRGEEVAFLLLLGSYPNTASIPPGNDPTRGPFDSGEGRVHFARGLELGLQGKLLEDTLAFRPAPVKAAEGTDRVFMKLLAAWLEHREPAADVVPDSLWLAARHGAKEVLPFARTIAADKFPHDREPPWRLYAAALALVARAGTREDLPLFEKYFKDESVIATFELEDGKTGEKGAAQLRDVAFGLTLVLCGEDPAKYGFVIAGRRWTQTYARTVVGPWDPCAFGFLNGDDNKSRRAAHAEVKAFLDKQPKPEPNRRP
jgi:RNA polymerase sigma factor (sigma-70 family)